MTKKLCGLVLSLSIILSATAQTTVTALWCENKVNPAGIDVLQPVLSWQLQSSGRNVQQAAYEIRVAATAQALQKGSNLVWKSGKINSPQSVFVPYAGKPLQPGGKYYWQVRVWDNTGKSTAWSETAYWQMSLLNAANWKAQWIEPGFTEDPELRQSALLRKTFSLAKKISSATLYVTAHGLYEASINGKRVGDAYLTPGWTSYNKRLQYQQYDVTDLLQKGKNTVGVALGSGWYRGYLAWDGHKDIYGKKTGLLLQLDITYSNGDREQILSDGSWKSSSGSIISAEIYHGEMIDATKEKTGWKTAGYNDTDWSGVQTVDYDKSILIATYNEPIRKHETFTPIQVLTTPLGEKVIDFGQNLVGWVQVKLKGRRGDTVKIYHAEMLDKAGNFYTENLRAAKATATYILKGEGEEFFEPHFTFFGFRYIKIEGITGNPDPANFTAVALYSGMPPAGSFSCSNKLVNQLQHNIQWGQKGNFLDVPTDCPQRDERLGWTGDAQVFSRTAAFNMNVHNFFAKWLQDVSADQNPDGRVPHVIPNVLGKNDGGSAGWADVATIIPWNMYMAYGDQSILEQQYESMKAWIGFMKNNSTGNLWNKGFHFGDWLFYRPHDDNDGRSAITDKYLIAQCFYAYSTQLLIQAAEVLGKTDDVTAYTDLLKDIKAAFVKEYTTASGRLVSGSQTAYVLALNFDMLPEQMREQAAQRLVDNIRSYGNHLTTGFLGTPYLCHVLTRFGYTDVAYQLLLQETYPSWLYPVKMGATTIWERWDGRKPDGTFQVPTMNSFNHYAYGAIGDWLYRTVAGIQEEAPGYKQILIKPVIGGKLTEAKATLNTYYGSIASHWTVQDDGLLLEVEVPVNTTATIYIPATAGGMVTESGKPLDAVKEITITGREAGYIVVKAGSGKYNFKVVSR